MDDTSVCQLFGHEDHAAAGAWGVAWRLCLFRPNRIRGGNEMGVQANVSGLVNEYRTLFDSLDCDKTESLEQRLTNGAEWTPQAAEHLVQLARNYGSFMLRNALAISLALGIEDGDMGF